jgi:DNA-binding beta-propeller fold protein YncE
MTKRGGNGRWWRTDLVEKQECQIDFAGVRFAAMKVRAKMKIAMVAICVWFCLAGERVVAQSGLQGELLVLSKRAQTLSIVDPGSLQVLAKVAVGNDPHEVIASTDGTTAYVSNYGSGAYNTLAVVDLVGRKALPPVDLGPLRGPHGLAFVAGKTWFTAEVAKAIGSYDPVTKKVDWILGTGQNRTHMIYVSPDLQWIVTTNVSSGTVSIIEKNKDQRPIGRPPGGDGPPPSGLPQGSPAGPPPGTPPGRGMPGGDWNETVIEVGAGSEGFDISPDRNEIWVANSQDGTVAIIDRTTKKVKERVAANMKGANRLKFTVDGKLVLVSSLSGAELGIFDAASRKTIKRLTVGHGAAGILMEPNGKRAFVACTPDSYVAVVDLKTLEVVGKIDAGPEPDGMDWRSGR